MYLEIAVPTKYVKNFWRTIEVLLIICEINLILSWSANCAICEADRATTFAITEILITKLYAPGVTLSTQNNTKLLEQLKSGFRRTINWNKDQSKLSTVTRNQYLDYLIHQSFQGV